MEWTNKTIITTQSIHGPRKVGYLGFNASMSNDSLQSIHTKIDGCQTESDLLQKVNSALPQCVLTSRQTSSIVFGNIFGESARCFTHGSILDRKKLWVAQEKQKEYYDSHGHASHYHTVDLVY